MSDTVKVAIIGVGRTGGALLKELVKYPFIKVVGVADRKPNAAGIKLAKTKKIFAVTDVSLLLKKAKSIDILIEVTGDPVLKKQMKDYLAKTNNKKTIIMHELIARMIISVCTKKKSLIASFHPKNIGIG